MAEKTVDEIYKEKVANSQFFESDPIEFELNGDYGTIDACGVTEKIDHALISFAAGFEEGLPLYLNQDSSCCGAHLLGEVLGHQVSYFKCATAWLNFYKTLCKNEAESEEPVDKESSEAIKRQYLQNVRMYLDKARDGNREEYEFGEAEYLLACGKREEAKELFLKLYRANGNFSYAAKNRIEDMYAEDHPELMQYDKQTFFEKWGENTTLSFVIYFFAVIVSWLCFPLTIAMVALNLYAGHKSKEYWKKQHTKGTCPELDLSIECWDTVYTSPKNRVSADLFKLDFVSDRPQRPRYDECIKRVTYQEKYYDSYGRYQTRNYTREEHDYEAEARLRQQYIHAMVLWHNGVMEKVRQYRIENWKRLKDRVERGDLNAELLMRVMGFNLEHHNNGVAQIPTSITTSYEAFTFNTVAAWAPYEAVSADS